MNLLAQQLLQEENTGTCHSLRSSLEVLIFSFQVSKHCNTSLKLHNMKLAQEQVIENEEALILDAYTVVKKSLEKKYANTEMLRRFHAKGLGLVAATFTVFDGIPEHLRTGLFETPKTFNAWIRFSNAQPKVLDDKKKAPRGMAIKVLETSTSNFHDDPMGANTQDFVLTTNEILFPGTVKLYLQSL